MIHSFSLLSSITDFHLIHISYMPRANWGEGYVFGKAKERSTLNFKNRLPVAIRKNRVSSEEIFHEFFILDSLICSDLKFTMTHTSQGFNKRWNYEGMKLIFICVYENGSLWVNSYCCSHLTCGRVGPLSNCQFVPLMWKGKWSSKLLHFNVW